MSVVGWGKRESTLVSLNFQEYVQSEKSALSQDSDRYHLMHTLLSLHYHPTLVTRIKS